jgi:hypothetical protein
VDGLRGTAIAHASFDGWRTTHRQNPTEAVFVAETCKDQDIAISGMNIAEEEEDALFVIGHSDRRIRNTRT